MSDRITVEQLVRIRIPSHETLLDLCLTDALALHQGLDAIFQPRLICGWDPGAPQGSEQMIIRIPVAEPPAETGPSLQDDIEAMIAGHTVDATEKIDDADEQEQEFLSRLPACDPLSTPIPRFTGRTVGEVEFRPDGSVTITDVPSNTPEPSAEPEPVAEAPAPSNDRQVEPEPKKTGRPRAQQSDEARALDLYTRYRERFPQETPTRTVSRIPGHYPSPRPSTDEVRRWLRAYGCDIPEPMTRAEVVAKARAIRAASQPAPASVPHTAEAPKPSIEEVNAPMPLAGVGPEATIQLIHALARSARRRWPDDERSIRTHIEDLGPLTQLRKVSDAAIALFDSMNRVWLDAYTDLPPFKQRDVDASLLTEWKRLAA